MERELVPNVRGIEPQNEPELPKSHSESRRDIQLRLLGFCKVLYDEANYRRERLNDAVKVYLGFLTFILGAAAFKTLTLDGLNGLLRDGTSNDDYLVFVALGIVSTALGCLTAAIVFTIRILKMWRYPKLSDPEEITIRAHLMDSESELIAAIIGKYNWAIAQNHDINDEKARQLTWALFLLVTGLVTFVLGLMILYGVIAVAEVSR